MKETKLLDLSTINRITIDEKLADDLIRILVAPLKKHSSHFTDNFDCWEDEADELINPDNFETKLFMTSANSRRYPWNSLYEGRVFLVGKFKIDTERKGKRWYTTDARKKTFRCINRQIKEDIKEKYLRALEGRIEK